MRLTRYVTELALCVYGQRVAHLEAAFRHLRDLPRRIFQAFTGREILFRVQMLRVLQLRLHHFPLVVSGLVRCACCLQGAHFPNFC